ncbi:hypothetical protein JCM8208_002425 [Rhodotorula glutinis]
MTVAVKPPKRAKLRFDTTTGPQPNLAAKFRSALDFTKMYKAHQWTEGFDVNAAAVGPKSYRLTCATNPNCLFSITAEYTTFGVADGPVAGQSGFRISPTNFRPSHDHLAPYLALDVDQENARLALLDRNDPAVDHPPLVPVGSHGGFAGASDQSDDGVDVKPRVSAAPKPEGFAQASTATATPTPAPAPAHAHKATAPSSAVSAFGPGGCATPQSPHDSASAFAPGAAQQYRQPQQQQHYAPPPPPQQPQPTSRATSTAPAPSAAVALTPLQQQQLRTPLGQYLSDISPLLIPYLSDFAANDIPLSTTGQDLVDLDSGRDDDRTVFDTVKDVRTLPALLVALVADGTRKAKLRQLAAGGGAGAQGGGGGVDPRISVGLKKAAAEKWVRKKIDEGRVVRAQMEGAQSMPRL